MRFLSEQKNVRMASTTSPDSSMRGTSRDFSKAPHRWERLRETLANPSVILG